MNATADSQDIVAAVSDLEVRPPRPWLLFNELKTGPIALDLLLRWRWLPRENVGDNAPVLLLPGFGASARSMKPLARYLSDNGFNVQHWKMGRNTGQVAHMLRGVIDQVREITARDGRRVRIVGQSLGGYVGREVARDHPELVARVVTLGTPAWGGAKYTITATGYQRRGADLDNAEEVIFERFQRPIKQPMVVFWSRRDAVVSWPACIDRWSPKARHVEIDVPHLAMCLSAKTLPMIRDALLPDA